MTWYVLATHKVQTDHRCLQVCGAICGLAVCEALDVMDFGSTWKEATGCFILFLAVAVAYLKRQPAAAKARSYTAPGRFKNGFEVRR